jgi:hypothetical protein
MNAAGQTFLVRRDSLDQTRVEGFDPGAALAPGQVQCRIEHFALTANNVTYAVFGDNLQYWRFFPAAAPWGCVPVWGFATVERSSNDAVPVGERVYGFWPMATHARLEPGRVTADGWADRSAARAELPAIYNRYQRVPVRDADQEAISAVLRPLFATAWLIDDFLDEAEDFGARQCLVSSASSRTAWATAFCLRRRGRRASLRLVGLTSPARCAATESLGLYDRVVDYGALRDLPADESAVYIDFSGDAALRRAVHGHWAGALTHSASIGGTHHAALGNASALPGPRPTLFFAPSRWQQRSAPPPQGLGREALLQSMDEAWRDFVARVTDPAAPLLVPQFGHGTQALRGAWLQTLQGRADPRQGLMIAL